MPDAGKIKQRMKYTRQTRGKWLNCKLIIVNNERVKQNEGGLYFYSIENLRFIVENDIAIKIFKIKIIIEICIIN